MSSELEATIQHYNNEITRIQTIGIILMAISFGLGYLIRDAVEAMP